MLSAAYEESKMCCKPRALLLAIIVGGGTDETWLKKIITWFGNQRSKEKRLMKK